MASGPGDQLIYEFGSFRLDPAERLLARDGEAVTLTPKAFDLLVYLVERHGRLVEKQSLISALWPDAIVEEANLAYNVSALRKVLDDRAEGASTIQTVPTKGYRFLAPVTVISRSATAPSPDRPAWWGSMRAKRIALVAFVCVASVWLAFSRYRSAPKAIEVDGSRRGAVLTRLTAAPPELALASASISPDGKYLAYSNPMGIHVQDIDTGETHRISEHHGDVFGWTRDGTRIRVFDTTQAGWDIALIGGAWQRSGLSWPDGSISISPDSSCRLSVVDRELRVNNVQGNSRPVLRLAEDDEILSATWTPDAKRVFFVRRDSARLETFALQDGATAVAFVAAPDQIIRWVGPVTPDARVILLIGSRARPDEISLQDLRTDPHTGMALGTPRWLTEWRDGSGCLLMSASADGRRVALLAATRQTDVYIAEFDKATGRVHTPRRLTLSERWEDPSAWLPDNRTVVFSAETKGPQRDRRDIFKQDIEAEAAEPLVTGAGYKDLARLTPDGRWLLFLQWFEPFQPAKKNHVMRVPVEGGLAVEIAESPGTAIPQCSVSGRCILYDARDSEATLYELDPMKGRGAALATIPRIWSGGYISPDGLAFSYVALDREPFNRIRTISFVGKSPREIVVRGAHNLYNLDPLPDGSGWLSSDDQNGLMYIASDGQSRVLWSPTTPKVWAATPSRDSKHLAMQAVTYTTNAWLLTRF
jgi:DNA-binding winged helix-turn-helix (wHTH) protein